MKKILFVLFLSISFSANAGFFTSVAAGMVANSLGGGGASPSTLKSINTYLWNMHKAKKYTDDYKYYLDYLENNTSSPNQLDTVATVYYDNGDKAKAIEIYEKRILPIARFTSSRTSLEKTYLAFSGKKHIDYEQLLTKLYNEKQKLLGQYNSTSDDISTTDMLIIFLLIANMIILLYFNRKNKSGVVNRIEKDEPQAETV